MLIVPVSSSTVAPDQPSWKTCRRASLAATSKPSVSKPYRPCVTLPWIERLSYNRNDNPLTPPSIPSPCQRHRSTTSTRLKGAWDQRYRYQYRLRRRYTRARERRSKGICSFRRRAGPGYIGSSIGIGLASDSDIRIVIVLARYIVVRVVYRLICIESTVWIRDIPLPLSFIILLSIQSIVIRQAQRRRR